ncbi:MAG TPA: MopE-related protein, partial [Ottowia sp.]|nr:MopE-related protein [Ottowia sp.]
MPSDRPATFPGATEVAGDNVDDNCDGGELCFADADDDGYRPNATATVTSADADCLDAREAVAADPVTDRDDTHAAIRPGAAEVIADGVDQDCTGGDTCW